ncbi:MAG: cytochrome P450 [Myxococcota bacterium]
MPLLFEPYSHAHKTDPYSAYRALRDTAPIHYAPESNAWVLSRFEDVSWALRHPEWFSSQWKRPMGLAAGDRPSPFHWLRMAIQYFRFMRTSPLEARGARMLAHQDGATHAAMRALVRPSFRRDRIENLEKQVREIVDDCLEPMVGDHPIDVIGRLADPLPVRILGELLGLGSSRREKFKQLADTILAAGTGEASLDGGMIEAMAQFRHYLQPIIRERAADPGDDLLSQLLQADDGGLELSEFEVYLFVQLLLMAGTETTTNLIGNAVDALLAHPKQLAMVHAAPDRWLPAAIEESLRWDGPIQIVNRTTRCTLSRHGAEIPADAHVVLLVGAANRDERRFAAPDTFDIERDTRGHLAFGQGHHFCVGAGLARLEARVALEALLPHLMRCERACPEVEFLDSFLVRGRSRLELRLAA